jgi:hypothetical protein
MVDFDEFLLALLLVKVPEDFFYLTIIDSYTLKKKHCPIRKTLVRLAGHVHRHVR